MSTNKRFKQEKIDDEPNPVPVNRLATLTTVLWKSYVWPYMSALDYTRLLCTSHHFHPEHMGGDPWKMFAHRDFSLTTSATTTLETKTDYHAWITAHLAKSIRCEIVWAMFNAWEKYAATITINANNDDNGLTRHDITSYIRDDPETYPLTCPMADDKLESHINQLLDYGVEGGYLFTTVDTLNFMTTDDRGWLRHDIDHCEGYDSPLIRCNGSRMLLMTCTECTVDPIASSTRWLRDWIRSHPDNAHTLVLNLSTTATQSDIDESCDN